MASNNSLNSSPLSNKPLYEEISVIGNGAYGTVYKGYDLKTNIIVAMKRIRIQITQEGLPISTIREIAYLRHLEKYDHENIVKLLDVINGPRLASEQSVILIFEYVDFDLHNYLRTFSAHLSLSKITDLMKQMLSGVDFLHSNRVIHRDLKPQNILVTKEGKVKIADFGLARIYGISTAALTSVVVTLWYRSPEVLLHSTYSSSVDIWSLGCIFAELYLKRPLFAGKSDIDQLYKIFDILGLPSQSDWPTQSVIPLDSFRKNINLTKQNANQFDAMETSYLKEMMSTMDECALDLLNKFLNFNVPERISARDALKHAYFKQQLSLNQQESNEYLSSKENIEPALINFNQIETSKKCDNLGAEASENFSSEKFADMANFNFHQPNILKRKRIQSLTNGASNSLNQHVDEKK